MLKRCSVVLGPSSGCGRQFRPERESLAPGCLETELDLCSIVATGSVEEIPHHDLVCRRDLGLVRPAFGTTVDAELIGGLVGTDAVVNETNLAISELDASLALGLGEWKGDTEALGVGFDCRQLETGENTSLVLVESEGDRGMVHDLVSPVGCGHLWPVGELVQLD